jgi:hypothetical protein
LLQPSTAPSTHPNNLSLNISKTKELILDYRKRRGEHASIHFNEVGVERVKNIKFFGVHITKELTWTPHTHTFVTRAKQHLFTLRRLKRFGMGPQILKSYTAVPLRVS